ncbi:hypothetical protein ACYCBF_26895, partial [Klebsiella pneumoniae]
PKKALFANLFHFLSMRPRSHSFSKVILFFLCDRGRTVFQKLSFSFCATVVAQFLKATILVFRGKGVPPKSASLRHPHTKHLLDNKLHRWQANAAGGA